MKRTRLPHITSFPSLSASAVVFFLDDDNEQIVTGPCDHRGCEGVHQRYLLLFPIERTLEGRLTLVVAFLTCVSFVSHRKITLSFSPHCK